VLPRPPVLTWLYEQEPYLSFEKQKLGPNYLHIHGSGSPLVDISEVSRLLYAEYDSSLTGGQGGANGSPEKSVVYFEFDQNDGRYRNISSLLTYLVDTMLWHFWPETETLAYQELTYLSDINAWTVKDLYHIYSRLRSRLASKLDLTFFISCFDQCQADERKWFMDRILHEQTYSEASCRMIISTSSSDGLGIDRIIQGRHVNLLASPLFAKSSDNLMDEYTLNLKRLIDARPIYDNFLSQIQYVLQSCNNAPELGRIILTWLESCHRGSSKNEVAVTIDKLSSVTVETVIDTIISTLTTSLKVKCETAMDWITHAAEPWSPEALVEALKVHMSPNEEPCLDDLDNEAEIAELEKALCGIIIIENRNVKFSHPSFYRVTGPNEEESRARINSSIATACLRYFQFERVQKTLDESCSARLATCFTPLDAVVVFHPRITMAEYAVRFWHRHYLASGEFKPKHLVHELFGNKQARASWEVTFWLLSNPFTRIDRNYLSTLPVFAMLGLEDLVGEKLISEEGQPWFNDDCWDAIIEAVRSGSARIARKLLDLVTVDAKKLQKALLCAAVQDNSEILDVLLAKASQLESFQWPQNLLHRAATMGQENVLCAMLKAGSDVNKNGIYFGACPAINAAWRGQVSALALLLNSENKLDLSMEDFEGDDLLMVAVRVGDPDLVKLIIDAGAKLKNDTDDADNKGMVVEAIKRSAHRVVDLLLQSGVLFGVGERKGENELELAACRGRLECVRVLLRHHEKMDAQCTTGKPLHGAVAHGHKDVVRIFLEHDPKPSMDVTPPGQNTLLVRAIYTGDIDLVSLLIEHGAKIDYVDPKGDFAKTPLSRACVEGRIDLVKLLLKSKADVNYTGGESDPPLFAALFYLKADVAKYLLKETDPDVMWRASDGMGMLHAAFYQHEILSDLLSKGAPIDGTSIWGTVLHMAVRDGCLSSIKTLLNNDPKPNLEAVVEENSPNSHEFGYTPLQLACANNSFESIKLLLEAGANPYIKNRENEDLVDILLRVEPGSEDCEKALKLLLSMPYSLTVEPGRCWLHSIHEKTSVNVMRLLTESKSDLDVRDKEGYTPLAMAISKSNKDVAKYLIEQGGKVNVFHPTYGSILHLATSKGDLDLVKLLLKSGADPEMVDTDYGESLVYTALGIEDSTKLYKMMRYLVEEAKVPVDRMGGKFAYAIIRAAHMTKAFPEVGTRMLKFLIRHKARLRVTDNQGRRAAHFVCTSTSSDGIKVLIQGGEDMLGCDTFGRLPIHFAASNPDPSCFHYLLDECSEAHVKFVNTRDNDQWTPLMWAARSGSIATVHKLLSENAECWTRSIDGGWSALKLANFADRPPSLTEQLVPKKHSRVKQDGSEEEWGDSFHRAQTGHKKDVVCDSCLVVSKDTPYKWIGFKLTKIRI
jgi:ankyrin repeat protein